MIFQTIAAYDYIYGIASSGSNDTRMLWDLGLQEEVLEMRC